jgi:sporulation protein YlmC with PRC-barrel domain
MQTYGSSLTNRNVIRENGSQLGTLLNITFDPTVGTLKQLVVEPVDARRARDLPFNLDNSDNYRIPAERVKASDDCIVVE